MRRYLLLLALCLLFGSVVHAQSVLWKEKRVEVNGSLGSSQLFGDIGGFSNSENALGFKDLTLKNTRFNLSFDVSYRIIEDANIRLNFAYGMFHTSDEKGSNIDREFESKTNFFEPSVIFEYYVIKNKSEGLWGFTRRRNVGIKSFFQSLDFYVFTGFGGLAYGVTGNEALEDHPNFKDGGFTAIIPGGIGVNMIATPDYNFGLELGGRYSFSDYLDGYTSQYSEANDVYYFLNVSFTYKMNTNLKGVPTFR